MPKPLKMKSMIFTSNPDDARLISTFPQALSPVQRPALFW